MEQGHKRKKSAIPDMYSTAPSDVKSEEETLRAYITRVYTEQKHGPYADVRQRNSTENEEWRQAFDIFVENGESVVAALESAAQISRENVTKLDAVVKDLETVQTMNQSLVSTNKYVKVKAANFDAAAVALEKRLRCFTIASQIESKMKIGPSGGNVKEFFDLLDELCEAESFLAAHKNYLDADQALKQIKEVKASGIASSSQYFTVLIRRSSVPVVLQLEEAASDPKSPPSTPSRKGVSGPAVVSSAAAQYVLEPEVLEDLKLTARKLGNLGISTCATEYASHRSNFLLGTLKKLEPVKIVASVTTPQQMADYKAGGHNVFLFMNLAMKLIMYERDLAEDILSHQFSTVWGDIVNPVISCISEMFEKTSHHIRAQCEGRPSRMFSFGFFIIADLFNGLSAALDSIDVITRPEVEKHSPYLKRIDETIKVLQGELIEFLHFFRSVLTFDGTSLSTVTDKKSSSSSSSSSSAKMRLPKDGSVHEITAFSVTFLKRCVNYKEAMEVIITQMRIAEKEQDNTVGRNATTQCGSFILQTVNDLLNGLYAKVEHEKDPSLKAVFLLNNFQHILKGISVGSIEELVGVKFSVVVKKLTDLVGKQKEAIKDTWKEAIEAATLDDPSQVDSVTKKAYVKKKFTTFNEEVQRLYALQRQLFIADLSLRDDVRSIINTAVGPVYSAFLERYEDVHFTSNRAKYVLYTPETLRGMIGGLFEGIMDSDSKKK